MSLLDRPQLSPIQQSPGMMEENPFIFHGDPMIARSASHEQMYNEIGILTTIDHPNVSYFHGFIEEPTKFILITELC